jgi:sodium-coupled monocarboxylate transporter 8/12
VVWTDAFQMVVMIVGFLTVLIQGSIHAGGFHNVLEQAKNGSRLDIVEYVQCYFFMLYKDLTSCHHQLK